MKAPPKLDNILDPYDLIINGKPVIIKTNIDTIIEEMDKNPIFKSLMELSDFVDAMNEIDWKEICKEINLK